MKKNKRGGGRHKHTGLLTGIRPGHEQWSDIANRIIHGHQEWRMVRLRQLISARKKQEVGVTKEMLLKDQRVCKDEKTRKKYDEALREIDKNAWQLADNYLSARKAQWESIAAKKRYVLLDEIDALWHDLVAQFERAVLNDDAEWFEHMTAAIRFEDGRTESQKERARFNAEVIRRLEGAFWWRRTKRTGEHLKHWTACEAVSGKLLKHLSPREAVHLRLIQSKRAPYVESATLTPADKEIDAKARQILESFHARKDAEPVTFTPEKKREIRELEQMNKKAVVEDIIGQPYKLDENGEPVPVSNNGGALIVEWKEGERKFTHRFKNERCALDGVRDVIGLLQLRVADTQSVDSP
jgi:hypothetical protein